MNVIYDELSTSSNTGYEAWDVNQDGLTDVLDMIIVSQHWNETDSPGWIRADVNKDGFVNALDSILIGQHWTR